MPRSVRSSRSSSASSTSSGRSTRSVETVDLNVPRKKNLKPLIWLAGGDYRKHTNIRKETTQYDYPDGTFSTESRFMLVRNPYDITHYFDVDYIDDDGMSSVCSSRRSSRSKGSSRRHGGSSRAPSAMSGVRPNPGPIPHPMMAGGAQHPPPPPHMGGGMGMGMPPPMPMPPMGGGGAWGAGAPGMHHPAMPTAGPHMMGGGAGGGGAGIHVVNGMTPDDDASSDYSGTGSYSSGYGSGSDGSGSMIDDEDDWGAPAPHMHTGMPPMQRGMPPPPPMHHAPAGGGMRNDGGDDSTPVFFKVG